MAKVGVESKIISFVDYDKKAGTLEVEFKSGAIYIYQNVPPEIFDRLIHSSSVGSYFSKHVRNVYAFRQVR